jgi:hypothetical protein
MLAAALAIGNEWDLALVLVEMAPHLKGEALERGLDAALAIRNEQALARALAGLALQLTGGGLERGLNAALAIESKKARAEALASLAPQLTGEARRQAAEYGLEATLAIGWHERDRGEWLAALAPHLTGEALERGLAAALSTRNERARAKALAAFLPGAQGSAVVLHSALRVIADHLLHSLSAATREAVLELLAEERLFAPPLLGQDTLAAIAGHIIEVCEEWRWM